MNAVEFQQWVIQNPILALSGIITLSALLFLIARSVIARGLIYLAARTKTTV